MIIKYAEYNKEFDENLLPDMVNDLILSVVEYEWSEIIIDAYDNINLTIEYNEDNELLFEENYLKYITPFNISYLEYMSITKISIKHSNKLKESSKINISLHESCPKTESYLHLPKTDFPKKGKDVAMSTAASNNAAGRHLAPAAR